MARKLPQIITKDEFELIFETARKSNLKRKKEYMIAMLLGFEAGMRISEIIGLKAKYSKCCNAKLIVKRITIKNKNYKKTYCSVCDKEVGIKNVYINVKGDWWIPPLKPSMVDATSIRIISGKGQKDRVVPRPKRLNSNAVKMLPLKVKRRALQSFVKKLGREVLKKDISFHTLRHGFVTHLIEQGRPLHEVQMLAGHSRLDTTGVYLHANPTKAIDGAREVF